jgi:hypothetical protein
MLRATRNTQDEHGRKPDEVITQLGALERDLAGMKLDFAGIHARLDHIGRRLDRVERRLDLIDEPTALARPGGACDCPIRAAPDRDQ